MKISTRRLSGGEVSPISQLKRSASACVRWGAHPSALDWRDAMPAPTPWAVSARHLVSSLKWYRPAWDQSHRLRKPRLSPLNGSSLVTLKHRFLRRRGWRSSLKTMKDRWGSLHKPCKFQQAHRQQHCPRITLFLHLRLFRRIFKACICPLATELHPNPASPLTHTRPPIPAARASSCEAAPTHPPLIFQPLPPSHLRRRRRGLVEMGLFWQRGVRPRGEDA